MTALVANNAGSRLAGSIDTTQTSITVKSADADKFPSPTGDQWFPLTLIKPDGQLEIVRATARAGDVITVVRAQESTTAKAFDVDARVELRLTKAFYDQFSSEFDETITSLNDQFSAKIADIDAKFDAGKFTRYDVASLATTTTIDFAAGNIFTVQVTGPTTLTLTNIPAMGRGQVVPVHLYGSDIVDYISDPVIVWDEGAKPELGENFTRLLFMWDGITLTGTRGAKR